MSELIKREDAIKATWHEPSYIDPYNILTEVRDRIETLPTVDAVPVVRCGECRWWSKDEPDDEYGYCYNGKIIGSTKENWYCADGERRSDEQQ